ncbi:hypothetical protein [Candidatus Villigracilis saccharophilus]|uniref:hypothetical protein n=1 Tax=Candidatus Villigracilis saccharophilus TaxID=3140684 RepID=UPI0031EF38BC
MTEVHATYDPTHAAVTQPMGAKSNQRSIGFQRKTPKKRRDSASMTASLQGRSEEGDEGSLRINPNSLIISTGYVEPSPP